MRERLLLAIESSCDESAVALVRGGREVLAERVASQTAIHAPFGGVIPEVAARAHHEWLPRLLSEVLQEAEGLGVAGEIEGVALTTGPGLVGSLLVGAGIGSAWAWARGLPVLPVNHLEGHLRAAWLREAADVDAPTLPAIGLVVSGGHTLLVRIERDGAMQRLGGTIDDAAGEAFDKVARFLELGHPGGPAIDRIAQTGDDEAIDFPRAMLHDGLDLSFSGLKTAVVNHVRKHPEVSTADVAASFQRAVVDVLVAKATSAARACDARTIALGGGVAANSLLRDEMSRVCAESGWRLVLPSRAMCTDNAAMIASAGWYRLRSDGASPLSSGALPNLKLTDSIPR